MSIASTFFMQLFRTKVFRTAFLYWWLRFFFGKRNMVQKMLIKCWWDLLKVSFIFVFGLFSASGCPLANRNKKLGLGLDGTTVGNADGGGGSCAGLNDFTNGNCSNKLDGFNYRKYSFPFVKRSSFLVQCPYKRDLWNMASGSTSSSTSSLSANGNGTSHRSLVKSSSGTGVNHSPMAKVPKS